MRGNVTLRNGRSKLLAQLTLDLDEVHRVEEETGTLVELPSSTEGICAERLGKPP